MTGFALPDGTVIRTAEHMLASIAGMGLDSAVIDSEGGEIPILDGSAFPFAQAISEAGTVEFGEKRPACAVTVPVVVDDVSHRRFAAAFPSDKLRVTYVIDYSATPVGVQHADYEVTKETFLSTISRARTFCLTSELDYLKKNGLAKGGTLENAVVFGENGPVNKEPLRFPLECVTHKVLDLLGDIMLTGSVPVAHYAAVCAGHEVHDRLAAKIKRLFPGA